jgi:hypothetical protein
MTTMGRRFILIALPLAIVVTLCVLAMLPPCPAVTKASFDRIQEGMTKAEVEQIFGGEGHGNWGNHPLEGSWYVWIADDGSVAFIHILDGCVRGKEWHDSHETFRDKIRRWLHLR